MLTDRLLELKTLASIVTQGEDVAKGFALELVGETTEEYFTTPFTRALYTEIQKCVNNNTPPTLMFLGQDVIGGYPNEVVELMRIATSNKMGVFIGKLKTLYIARNLSRVSQSTHVALSDAVDVQEALQTAESNIMEAILAGQVKGKDEGYICDYMQDWFKTKQRQMTEKGIIGVPSGFSKLDNILGGFRGGDTVVVAGRTGMGKSSLVATMMTKQTLLGYKPALFTFELNRVEVIDKEISQLSEFDSGGHVIPFSHLYNPAGNFGGVGLSSKDLMRMDEISKKYMNNNESYIRGASSATVEEVMARIRKLKTEGNCDIAYVDHLGLLVKDKNKAVAELTHITNSLKLFSAEVGVPIVEVVQLRRDADTSSSKPKLSHLKGSGSIEEDANIVLMPWRPHAIDNELDPSESEIILAKSRNSGTGNFPTYFSEITTSFTEIDSTVDMPEEGRF